MELQFLILCLHGINQSVAYGFIMENSEILKLETIWFIAFDDFSQSMYTSFYLKGWMTRQIFFGRSESACLEIC